MCPSCQEHECMENMSRAHPASRNCLSLFFFVRVVFLCQERRNIDVLLAGDHGYDFAPNTRTVG